MLRYDDYHDDDYADDDEVDVDDDGCGRVFLDNQWGIDKSPIFPVFFYFPDAMRNATDLSGRACVCSGMLAADWAAKYMYMECRKIKCIKKL